MKPWGKGSRTSNIEDLDIFKTTVLQIEATGNFKNFKRMQKISAVNTIILLHEKFLQFDWLRAVVFQLNLKYLHVKITNLLCVVV